MILYLHGFNSSPSSFKAKLFLEQLQRLGRRAEFVCPFLPVSPSLAVHAAEQSIDRFGSTRVGVIGSSMGGYYATWLAEKYGFKAALVNPAVEPYKLLRDYLGAQKNLYTGQQYTLTLQLVEQLRAFEVAALSQPERYLLLTQTGDEVLDYRAAVEKYRGARQVVIDGGDHDFRNSRNTSRLSFSFSTASHYSLASASAMAVNSLRYNRADFSVPLFIVRPFSHLFRSMNVFYEEDGSFKVGAVLADNNSSLQVEAPHGKRSKIKSNAVLLHFQQPALPEFMPLANNVAEQIDVDFLWECSPQAEFSFDDLALEYFGASPGPVEAAGVLLRLHSSPVHFYKKGRGHYKAAPAESLKLALAAIEKRRLQATEQERMAGQLASFTLPEEFRSNLPQLLYAPDKNTLIYKALEAARAATQMTVPRLLEKCGALPSAHDYHFDRFLFEFFPDGVGFGELPRAHVPNDLPPADVSAFSIDDATTTEIDDAFSVTALAAGGWRIGIHIAAPALGFGINSAIDAVARQRLSTVYMPGRKITMLPEQVVQPFSLIAGEIRPALSLYLDLASDFSVIAVENRLDCLRIAANLRHDALETVFNETSIAENQRDYPFADELNVLWRLANRLEQGRGKSAAPQTADYSFYVDKERISIAERRRGSPVDKVVAELMIFANAEWGRQLAEHGIEAIYRAQGNGKVKMTTEPLPHQGLGVGQYVWASSPLRRYIDLINQRQLLAWISKTPASYQNGSEELLTAIRDFELTYAAYSDFQKTMERYWCLRWLLQGQVELSAASVIKENLIKLDALPLYVRAPSLPDLPAGSQVEVAISQIDLFELTLACHFKHKIAPAALPLAT